VSTSKAGQAAQRAAAARARVAAAQRRRRLVVVGGSVLAIVAVVAVLIVVKVSTGSGAKSGQSATGAQAAVLSKLASVPPSVLDTVGIGAASGKPTPISAPALVRDGKPAVLYVGAEYCPFCAAERWAVVVALSRFGTLHGLGETRSSPSDVYPSTATLSFHGVTYTSSYLALTAKEIESNQIVNGKYAPLDTLSPADQAVFAKYNAPPYVNSSGGIPFIDLGGKYLVFGASYDPAVLAGKSQLQIATALSDPGSKIAQAVVGSANLLTATLCTLTSQQPAAVCTSSGVRAAATRLG
jgi:hypothetical protein